MDRDEVIKQLERWTILVLEEAIGLLDRGVGPTRLMAIAIATADARLDAEVTARNASGLTLPAGMTRIRNH
jgi:ribosomal protein L7/L12